MSVRTVFVALAAIAACASPPTSAIEESYTPALDSVRAKLAGTWDMVQGCGGIIGDCRSPSEFSEPARYVFRGDSVEAYREGERLYALKFVLTPGAQGSDQDQRPVLLIGLGPAVDPRPLRIRFEGNDKLFLDEGCCDMFTFEYSRVNSVVGQVFLDFSTAEARRRAAG